MLRGLQAFLSGIIDYAGLFPPARLPLDQALRNYARYRQGPEAWMLGRFVCPAGRLAELASFRDELFQSGPPLVLSVLATGGRTFQELFGNLDLDLDAVAAFRQRFGVQGTVDALEVRLPEELRRLHDDPSVGEVVGEWIMAAPSVIDTRVVAVLTPYYEHSLGAEYRALTAAIIAGIAKDHEPDAPGPHWFCRPAGFKLRCGGLEALAFPSSEQVAFTIVACRDAAVPLKFTAGLHHPLRHFDKDLQVHMHGFVSVFAAGVLAHARGLGEEEVRLIVEEEDPGSFIFSDNGLRWRDHRLTSDEIEAARKGAVTSFGSCSFEEPVRELRALGLLG